MAYRRAAVVAVLADVHGNLPALSAVLAEPDVAAADAVVLLGDIALGPMPAETLEVLAGLGERAIWVHGNCEREMVAALGRLGVHRAKARAIAADAYTAPGMARCGHGRERGEPGVHRPPGGDDGAGRSVAAGARW